LSVLKQFNLLNATRYPTASELVTPSSRAMASQSVTTGF
jgi:hypothetical protein